MTLNLDSIVCFALAAGLFILGVTQILGKGEVIFNHYYLIDEEKRKNMTMKQKRRYYLQGGTLFCFTGVFCVVAGFSSIYDAVWLSVLVPVLVILLVLYAFGSMIYFSIKK